MGWAVRMRLGVRGSPSILYLYIYLSIYFGEGEEGGMQVELVGVGEMGFRGPLSHTHQNIFILQSILLQ